MTAGVVRDDAGLHDGLTRLDNAGNLSPWLATKWESADNLTWRFTLRDGVKFSDGEPLDSAVVVRNLTEQKKALITGQSLAGVVDAPRPGPGGARFAFVANGDFSTATGETLQDQIAESIGAYVDSPTAPNPLPPPE